MPYPVDLELYEKIKNKVYKMYDRPSAYRSMALQKYYKQEFKKKYKNKEPYFGDDEKELLRWMNEKWIDINPFKNEKSYPVYRPTVRINDKTPITLQELTPQEIIKQSLIKQKIKNTKNLKPFKSK